MKIRNNQTILFIGDSITDCGRRGECAPLGSGYVSMFNNMLVARHPARTISVINKGISGDNAVGLRDRWHDDVIRNRPHWLSIKIGINDLYRTMHGDPTAVPPSAYREAYTAILDRTREALPGCRILLIEPFFISTSTVAFRGEVLRLLPEYLRIVRELSRTYGTLHVKTHAVFQRLLKHHEPETFCPEPVHPNPTGHFVIADAVYDALT